MLSNLSSYFTFKESPLHTAMKKEQLTEVDELIKNGANPAEQDYCGYSVIDRAIYDGKVKHLPLLFSAKEDSAQVFVSANKEIESFLKSNKLSTLIQTLNTFTPDKLTDKSSNLYKSFLSFLSENKTLKTPQGTQLIHLIALCGNTTSLKVVIETYPEMLQVKDNHGNTPLHYSAYNKDENCFVELVKQGSNLFTINASGVTALGSLVSKVQKEDPLNWDLREIFIFVYSWLPATFAAAKESGLLPYTPFLEQIVDMAFDYASTFSWLSLLREQFSSSPKKALFTLALFGTYWLPVINLPIRAYITYTFFSKAYQGIKNSWHEIGHRPFKAICLAGIKASNAYDSGVSFYNQYSIAKMIRRVTQLYTELVSNFETFVNNSNAQCGDAPESATVVNNDTSEVNPEFTKFVECNLNVFRNAYNKTLSSDPEINGFFEDAFKPFATEAAANCPQAYIDSGETGALACIIAHLNTYISEFFDITTTKSFSNCSKYKPPSNILKLSLEKRVKAAENSTDCLQAGLNIIKQEDICTKNPASACREFKRILSVDKNNKNKKDLYGELSVIINLVCETLKKAYKECKSK